MSIRQQKYLALFLGLVWFAAFAVWGLIRFPGLTWLALGMLAVVFVACAWVGVSAWMAFSRQAPSPAGVVCAETQKNAETQTHASANIFWGIRGKSK